MSHATIRERLAVLCDMALALRRDAQGDERILVSKVLDAMWEGTLAGGVKSIASDHSFAARLQDACNGKDLEPLRHIFSVSPGDSIRWHHITVTNPSENYREYGVSWRDVSWRERKGDGTWCDLPKDKPC